MLQLSVKLIFFGFYFSGNTKGQYHSVAAHGGDSDSDKEGEQKKIGGNSAGAGAHKANSKHKTASDNHKGIELKLTNLAAATTGASANNSQNTVAQNTNNTSPKTTPCSAAGGSSPKTTPRGGNTTASNSSDKIVISAERQLSTTDILGYRNDI